MNNKTNKTFELHNYLDIEGKPAEVINKILKRIPDLDDVGYAGHLEKKWLRMTLERLILDKEGENQYYLYKKECKEKINEVYEEVLMKCIGYSDEKVHIFLFPTFDKFVIEKMKGVSGFCPWKNTILIFISFVKGWENQLKETINETSIEILENAWESNAARTQFYFNDLLPRVAKKCNLILKKKKYLE